MQKARKHHVVDQAFPSFDIIHLLNYHNEPLKTTDELIPYLKELNSDGINVSANHIT